MKIFQHIDSYETTIVFEELYNILKSELNDEEKIKIQKEIIQQLISSLNSLLVSANFEWERYEKMHGYINSVLSSYDEPIGSLLSTEFIEHYFMRMSLNLKNDVFSKCNPKVFITFV
jgi:hypothetical protein